MVDESRGHLFNAVGYRPDIFAELLPKAENILVGNPQVR